VSRWKGAERPSRRRSGGCWKRSGEGCWRQIRRLGRARWRGAHVGALPRAASWGAGRAAALGARALAQRLLRTQTLPAFPSAPTGASARSRHALPLLILTRSPTSRSAPRGLLSSGCQCGRSVRCASSSSPRPPPLQCVPAHSSQCEPLL